jgi:uncharacterized protein YecE (DUF72 family)
MADLRIGTSGWNYPSGPGTWNGIFYPASRPHVRGRRFDELEFYAEHFDTVEVNASFYRPPDPKTTRGWVQRTPGTFDFSLKLFQKFTHPAMYRQSTHGAPAADPDASSVPEVSMADVDAFKASIEPIALGGKLGALLAQFPPSFRDTPDARAYLEWLIQAFGNYPIAVELRHRSWSDHVGQTLGLLNDLGAAWVQIDEPKFRFSIQQNHLPNLRGLYYMRLHGRNAEKWWTHDHPDERYNYLYSPGELQHISDTIANVRRLVQKIYLYLNNHFAAKAVANAATLRHELGQRVPGTYTREMLERYPFLRAFAAPGADGDAGRLFEEPGEPIRKGKKKPAGGAESREE